MQSHLDFTVSSVTELHRERRVVESLGAEVLLIEWTSPMELLFVFADLTLLHLRFG